MYSKQINDAYVASCVSAINEYHAEGRRSQVTRGFMGVDVEIEAPDKAAVVGEAIISFTGKLSKENRVDAQNAFLHASMIASEKYPGEEEVKEWYLRFRDVMEKTGWIAVKSYHNDLKVNGTSVRMDELVLGILKSTILALAIPGPASALMLKVAGDAVAALEKRNTALTLYEKNLLDQGVGGMAAGACTEVDGEVMLSLGVVRFKRRNTSDKVMFVDVDVRKVGLYSGEVTFVKHDLVANATRPIIEKYIVEKALGKIAEYHI